LSEDPTGLAGGDANFYRYVGNSPTNYTDPTGLRQAGNPLDSLFGGYRAGPVQPYQPISTALSAGTVNVLQAAPGLANFQFTNYVSSIPSLQTNVAPNFIQSTFSLSSFSNPANSFEYVTSSIGSFSTSALPSVQSAADYFSSRPGHYENLVAAARSASPPAPIHPSGITSDYIQSGAARRELDDSAIRYAQGAVQYGTPSQAFAGQFALTLNTLAENSHPAVGQLDAIDALTDRNASFTQKVTATGFGLLDTLLLGRASSLRGAEF
jgi:hypothetical protein